MHVTALSCSPATLSYGEDGVYSRRSFSMVGGVGSPPLPLRAVIVIVPIVSVLSYVMLVADVCMRKCLLVAERVTIHDKIRLPKNCIYYWHKRDS